jgi:hypothetical protein
VGTPIVLIRFWSHTLRRFKACLLIKIELDANLSNLGNGSEYITVGVRLGEQTKLLLDTLVRFVSDPQICIHMYLLWLRVCFLASALRMV